MRNAKGRMRQGMAWGAKRFGEGVAQKEREGVDTVG